MDGRLLLGDSTPRVLPLPARNGLLDHTNVLYKDRPLVREDAQHALGLATIRARKDFDHIIAMNL
jgi:hypothetical protein